MFVVVKTKDSDLILPESCFNKSTLILNLKEDGLLDKCISFKEYLSILDKRCMLAYLNEQEMPEDLNKCNIFNIIKFFDYFLVDSDKFITNYISKVDKGTIESTRHVFNVLIACKKYKILPIPVCYKNCQNYKICEDFKNTPTFVNLSPFSKCISYPNKTMVGGLKADISQGVLNTNIGWLEDFPWYKFNVGIAGGFVLSSLQNCLDDEQDMDMYILDMDHINPLLKYFDEKFKIKVCVPEKCHYGCSVLNISAENQRPLQIICTGYSKMGPLVRHFDMSHLRIWLDKNGLWVDKNALFEIERGFGRFLKPGYCNKRIEKYMKRGWMIFGDYRHFSPKEQTPQKMCEINLNKVSRYFKEPKVSISGYRNCCGVHIGDINDITCTDVENLKLFHNQDDVPSRNMINISGVKFFVYTNHITIYKNGTDRVDNNSVVRLNKYFRSKVCELMKKLYEMFDMFKRFDMFERSDMEAIFFKTKFQDDNIILNAGLSEQLSSEYTSGEHITYTDTDMVVELEINCLSDNFAKPILCRIIR